MKRAVVVALALFVTFSCTDENPLTAPGPDPRPSSTSETAANPRFAFLPPLAPQTTGEGEFHMGLSPVVEVCRLETASVECAAQQPDGFPLTFGMQGAGDVDDGSSAYVRLADDHYQVNWHTGKSGVRAGERYRVTVRPVAGGAVLGHAYVLFESRDGVAAADGEIETKAGRMLPVRFRIERGALCANPDGCVEEVITEEGGIVLTPSGESGVDVPADAVDAPIVIIVERVDVTQEPCLPTDLQQVGECYRFDTEPAISEVQTSGLDEFNSDVTVGICLDPFPDDDQYQLHKWDPEQPNLGVVPLDPAQAPFLECGDGTGGEPIGLLERAGRGLARLLGPAELAARDKGLGGLTTSFSNIRWARPLAIDILDGDEQSAPTGSLLPTNPTVRVTAAEYDGEVAPALEGVPVTFEVVSGGGGILVGDEAPLAQSVVATTDTGGVASVPWVLGAAAGENELRASVAGGTMVTFSATGVATTDPLTAAVDATSSFLRVEATDESSAPTVIDLESLGIGPGDLLRLEQLGDFTFSIYASEYIEEGIESGQVLNGVFSASNTLLSSGTAHRVPDAVATNLQCTTPTTLSEGLPTDIPEDFCWGDVSVEVPPGARFLFVGVPDSWYLDNADSDGDLAVRVTPTQRGVGAECQEVSEIPQAECDALVAFYNSVGGVGWTNSGGWLQTNTPCSWYGVSCGDGGGHVIELVLIGNGLTGTLPPELADLEQLETLVLNSNDLTGGVPPELGQLQSLRALSLYNNGLTGSIPPELGQLAQLEMLILWVNQLTGGIPPELGDLRQLRYIDLGNNPLGGTIPPELGNLENLEVLWVDTDELTGPIPLELMQLQNLQLLGLSDNAFSGPIPPELTGLTSLTSLRLEWNQFTGSIPSALGSMTQLVEINLSFNQLTGPIPTALANLTNLVRLDLWSNQLSGPIPPELGQLPQLQTLMLRENQLEGEIPVELADLANLFYLNLGGNLLTGGIPPELSNLSELWQLSLWGNQLTGPIPSELGSVTTLGRIYIGGNLLSGPIPAELGNLTGLIALSMDNNQLSGEIPAELGALINLHEFFLNWNLLTGPVPLGVAQVGAAAPSCSLEGNEGLYMPDTPEYRELATDGMICGVPLIAVDPGLAAATAGSVALGAESGSAYQSPEPVPDAHDFSRVKLEAMPWHRR